MARDYEWDNCFNYRGLDNCLQAALIHTPSPGKFSAIKAQAEPNEGNDDGQNQKSIAANSQRARKPQDQSRDAQSNAAKPRGRCQRRQTAW